MPQEYINKALDPFSDLENGSEINLGLTVSIQMVKDMGGDVVFDPNDQKGNKIRVKVPTMKSRKNSFEKQEASTG